jgi:hypothetical protein
MRTWVRAKCEGDIQPACEIGVGTTKSVKYRKMRMGGDTV